MDLQQLLDSGNGGPKGSLLKGSDVPEGTKSVSVVIAAIRKSQPPFKARAIADFKKPVYGKTGIALNVGNLKALIALHGPDDKNIIGKKVTFDVAMVENPETKKEVRGLRVKR